MVKPRDYEAQRRHRRVYAARGRASKYMCINFETCKSPARDWSQRHGTSGESIDDYDPRCVRCHKEYDMEIHRAAGARGSGNTRPRTEEEKKQHSEKMKAVWADPEYRAAMSAKRKAEWAAKTPEERHNLLSGRGNWGDETH